MVAKLYVVGNLVFKKDDFYKNLLVVGLVWVMLRFLYDNSLGNGDVVLFMLTFTMITGFLVCYGY